MATLRHCAEESTSTKAQLELLTPLIPSNVVNTIENPREGHACRISDAKCCALPATTCHLPDLPAKYCAPLIDTSICLQREQHRRRPQAPSARLKRGTRITRKKPNASSHSQLHRVRRARSSGRRQNTSRMASQRIRCCQSKLPLTRRQKVR